MDTPTLWIIQSTYLKPKSEIAEVTPRHREWLDQHYRSGTFLVSGRMVSGQGGVIVARANTQAELETIFATDPFVVENCSEYSYLPFSPVKRGKALDLDGIPLVE